VTGPATGVAGQTLSFTLGASEATASAAAGFRYAVDWGDRSAAQAIAASPGNGAGVVVSHVYAAAGSFTVRVTATDADGNTSPAATASVVIALPPPPHAVGVTLVSRIVGKGPHRSKVLYAQVSFSSGPPRLILSPLQAPKYKMVGCAGADLDGNGVFDAVLFTGRDSRTGKKVKRVIRL
jgi:hypothetical protein